VLGRARQKVAPVFFSLKKAKNLPVPPPLGGALLTSHALCAALSDVGRNAANNRRQDAYTEQKASAIL